MLKNTVCYSIMPITVQAGLRVRKLALHSNRSYGYAFSLQSGAYEMVSCSGTMQMAHRWFQANEGVG